MFNNMFMPILLAASMRADAGPLLAIAATPTPLTDQRFAAKLLQLDQATGKVTDVQQLASVDEGVLFMKSWTDAGFIVAGIPAAGPLTLRILNLRKPPRTVDVQLDRLCQGCTYVDCILFHLRPVGLLVLYNARSQQLIEFRTPHPDSEPLAVIDERLYYRVDDVLFAARPAAQGILEPQLIARNPGIRDVHWLFVYSEADK